MTTSFLNDLRIYMRAGSGIIAVRTRDPMATAAKVVEFCAGQDRPLKIWDGVRGWISGDDPVHGASAGNASSLDPMFCFRSILSPEVTQDTPDHGAFLFLNPHLYIRRNDPNPMMVQLLTLMAHALPTTRRRVVLTVSPGYQFPSDLQEIIPVIDHQPPSVEDLEDVAREALEDFKESASDILRGLGREDVQLIAQSGAGMIGPEFEAALARVTVKAREQRQALTGAEARSQILVEKAQMVRRNRSLEVMDAVDLAQVGGLDRLKSWVQTRVGAMQPEAWEAGVSKPKGCALVGPPGTGKSLCGKVIGTVLGVATIRFDLASVFSGLVGSSEENMREALFMLESLAPAVVLLDEVDKAISVSSGGDGGTSQKVLGTLLTFMQETKAPIFWVPTLNRTQNVPAEFLRTGRLDQVFGVSTPTFKERLEILRIHLRARKADPDKVNGLERIAADTERFVGAELEGIASEARLLAYNEGVEVNIKHLLAAKEGVRPLSKRMADQFEAMEAWCRDNATPANTPDTEASAPVMPRTRRRLEN